MTRRLPIVLALLAAIVVFAPRLPGDHRSRVTPETGGGSSAASVVPKASRVPGDAGPSGSLSEAAPQTGAGGVQSPVPALSGGIGEPASACKPGYCETPPPTVTVRLRGVSGTATFYAYHPGQAAAARLLRDHYGSSWRGAVVTVTGPAGQAVVVLSDYESSTIPGRLIDLNTSDFLAVCGALALGVCTVEVAP